ncbi:Hsp20/alpha crystallin family protein [Haloarchaeobius sp. DFWS5]|uniref:Hsp20/alpha crystallin family protein n=1 Tax=Haloarchaeobius sp. DFWS5 TaxID=3446114 RepID=UPI003EBB164F
MATRTTPNADRMYSQFERFYNDMGRFYDMMRENWYDLPTDYDGRGDRSWDESGRGRSEYGPRGGYMPRFFEGYPMGSYGAYGYAPYGYEPNGGYQGQSMSYQGQGAGYQGQGAGYPGYKPQGFEGSNGGYQGGSYQGQGAAYQGQGTTYQGYKPQGYEGGNGGDYQGYGYNAPQWYGSRSQGQYSPYGGYMPGASGGSGRRDIEGTVLYARPGCELIERSDECVFLLYLPGFEKSDIECTYEDGYFYVDARREGRDGADNYWMRRAGRVSERVYIPRDIDTDEISATYRNGVLEVHLPFGSGSRRTGTTVSIRD